MSLLCCLRRSNVGRHGSAVRLVRALKTAATETALAASSASSSSSLPAPPLLARGVLASLLRSDGICCRASLNQLSSCGMSLEMQDGKLSRKEGSRTALVSLHNEAVKRTCECVTVVAHPSVAGRVALLRCTRVARMVPRHSGFRPGIRQCHNPDHNTHICRTVRAKRAWHHCSGMCPSMPVPRRYLQHMEQNVCRVQRAWCVAEPTS